MQSSIDQGKSEPFIPQRGGALSDVKSAPSNQRVDKKNRFVALASARFANFGGFESAESAERESEKQCRRKD